MAVVMTLVGILAGLALASGPLWRWVGDHLVTMVHEAGHAVATVLCSYGRVSGIELRTHAAARRLGYAGRTRVRTFSRPANALVYAAGYPAPALLGLVVLALLHADHGTGALATLVGSLCVMLFLIRNLFGVFLVLLVGAAFYLTFLYGSATVQALVAGTFAWTLLFGSTRDAVRLLRFGTAGRNDADILATLVGASAQGWATLFVLATAGSTGYALWLTLTTWT